MDEGSEFGLAAIFVIVFLACAAQAVAPVSPPESRFVWEPGENLTFTWTNENFDGFYYDAKSNAGKESLTIKLDNLTDRWIKQDNIVYSTTVEQVTSRYSQFGEYAVIGFLGQKYLAGFPMGKSNITSKGGVSLKPLYKILIDENANYSLTRGSALTLSEYYVLKVKDANAAGVALSLWKEGIEVDTKIIETGKNYVYEIRDRPVLAVHIDSILKENETVSVAITGIFQASEQYTSTNERDIFGAMKITNVSDTGITMSNILPVNLKQGSIIEIIGNIKLKVADSDTPRVHLYSDCNENIEHRGAAGSNELSSWDGMNYAGFWYDVDSGNFSESLEVTNITGRTIPQGGLTYTSHRFRLLYPVTRIKGKKPPGTDGSYLAFRLWGNNYAVRSNGLSKILVGQGDCIYDKKTLLVVGPNEFNGDIWELGEGYTLTATSVNFSENPSKAQLSLRRNGVVLDDIWLPRENVYGYALPGENGTPKLITYLDAVFSGATFDMIQLRYTWFVSDNVTQIKEGDRLGIFNVKTVEPDRIVLTNREPIELKPGSSINLFGNLSFYVENSDELRFYPTNMGGTQMLPEEVTVNEVPDIPDMTILVGTSPAAGRTERVAGFEVIILLAALVAVYQIKGRKNR